MYDWKVSREGRLTGIKPIELVAPDIGIGKGGCKRCKIFRNSCKKF